MTSQTITATVGDETAVTTVAVNVGASSGFAFPGNYDAGRPENNTALGHLDLSTFVTPTILSDVGPVGTPVVMPTNHPNWSVGGAQAVFTANGQTIDGFIINGNVNPRGFANCTIRNCIIQGSFPYAIDNRSGGTNLTISHCIIDCFKSAAPNSSPLVSYVPTTVEWCEFKNFGPPAFGGNGSIYRDSVWYNNRTWAGDPHKECLFFNQRSNVQLLRNVFLAENNGTSTAVAIYNQAGSGGSGVDNWIVEDNLFAATGAYALYAGAQGHTGSMTNGRFRRNRFSTVYFPRSGRTGPYTAWNGAGSGNIWSGNVWHDGPNAGTTV